MLAAWQNLAIDSFDTFWLQLAVGKAYRLNKSMPRPTLWLP